MEPSVIDKIVIFLIGSIFGSFFIYLFVSLAKIFIESDNLTETLKSLF